MNSIATALFLARRGGTALEKIPSFAGIDPREDVLHTFVRTVGEAPSKATFPLTEAGLEQLGEWLEDHQVRKLALLQGGSAWPWQAENSRRLDAKGTVSLADWVRYRGNDAWNVERQTAWQPVFLSLSPKFTVFLVRSVEDGGTYPVKANRTAAETLAEMLAGGKLTAEYPKAGLERLIDDLATCQPQAVEESIHFFTSESHGHWHNRARAKMARRLKHCELDDEQRQRVVQAITRRLLEGDFTEQFKDQLRLLLHLDSSTAMAVSAEAVVSRHPHVRRYAVWLGDHE